MRNEGREKSILTPYGAFEATSLQRTSEPLSTWGNGTPLGSNVSHVDCLGHAGHLGLLDRFGLISVLIGVFIGVLLLGSVTGVAAERQCTVVSRTCAETATDGTGECIRWENTYRCMRATEEAGRCERLIASTPGAVATATNCLTTVGDVCTQTETRFTSPTRVTADGVTLMNYVTHREDVSHPSGPVPTTPTGVACTLAERHCVDSAARTLPYTNAPEASDTVEGVCWKEEETYACTMPPESGDASTANACAPLVTAGCALVDDVHCALTDTNGICQRYEATFRCTGTAGSPGNIGTGLTVVGEGTSSPTTTIGQWETAACDEKTAVLTGEGLTCTTESTCVSEVDGVCQAERVTLTCQKTTPGNCEALSPLLSDTRCQRASSLTGWASFSNDVDETIVCHAKTLATLPSVSGTVTGITGTAGTSGAVGSTGTATPPPLQSETQTVPHWTLVGTEAESSVTEEGLLLLNPETLALTEGVGVSCALTQTTCTSPGGWRWVDGTLTYRTCWEKTVEKACTVMNGDGADGDCAKLRHDPQCTWVRSTCPSNDTTCPEPTEVYRCTTPATELNMGERCDGSDCVGDLCAPTGALNDKTMVQALVQLEVARQLSIYGDVTNNAFFVGEALSCRDRSGTSSCCMREVTNTETTSNAAFSQMVLFAGAATVEGIKYVGSPYVYDALSWSPHTSGILKALYGNAPDGTYSPSFSYWGVTATYTATGWQFSFSGAGLLASAAISAYERWSACTAEDARVAMQKSQRLCHYLGEKCAKRTPGLGCTERQQVYVCFNSRLAKLVQESARQQLGIGWGTVDAPQARGLTVAELERLDWDRVDLTDFIADVMSQVDKTAAKGANVVDQEKARANAAARLKAMVNQSISPHAPTRTTVGIVPAGTQ
ncbi:MAG: conjugal transfer protein TraN [Sutterella sp.]|nr:conjugal transfer protein TraN [Sutterella sp.]